MTANAPYNRPKFCQSATWNQNGTTLGDNSTIGPNVRGLFVNRNNTLFAPRNRFGLVYTWSQGSTNMTSTLVSQSNYSESIFVSMSENIYIGYVSPIQEIAVCRLNSSSPIATLNTGPTCFHIFIDKNNSLYCSLNGEHQVIKRSLDSNDLQTTIVAGSNCFGFARNMLFHPNGIFVDNNFDLYVADSGNGRVQVFSVRQSNNGFTVAGWGASGTIDLHSPRDVVLDADGYLFIVDSDSHRIVGSGPDGFRCIVGCFNPHGSASHQLDGPERMAFDSHGNIYITDFNNKRIQKFLFLTNSCSK